MKGKCCRSTPRCADCPVRLAAARRRPGDLVTEILVGRPPKPLPPSVQRALAELEASRTQALTASSSA